MIGYLPEIYPDELIYSWFARYYAHNGYTCYSSALSDLLKSKISRIDIEFTGPLNESAKNAISKMYDHQDLILNHTMFPYYARFACHDKRQKALIQLVNGYGQIHNTLTFANTTKDRFLCYCPQCSTEDRETYGETYFHRVHQIRHIKVCPKHKCKLTTTDIRISSATSSRLYVAEDVIPQDISQTEQVYGITTDFAIFLTNLFQAPISLTNETNLGDYLTSIVDATEYSPRSGKCRYTTKLCEDIVAYYKSEHHTLPLHHLQRMLKGHNSDFHEISLLGFFLGITTEDLANPTTPPSNKADYFQRKVRSMFNQGLSCKRISNLIGASEASVAKVKQKSFHKPRNHSTRKGMHTQDWAKIDRESLPLVETAIASIKGNGIDRPGKVTERSVLKAMGWPCKRLDYLPLCKEIVQANMEPINLYWAREAVWAYNKLRSELGQKKIYWKAIRDLINIERADFEKTWPLLNQVADEATAEQIRRL